LLRNGVYGFATNRIGAYFSNDTAYALGGCILGYIPQITSNMIDPTFADSSNWMLFLPSFIANGGEEFLTIGNFFDDGNTLSDSIGGLYNCAYYWIDDVSLIECNSSLNPIEQLIEFIPYSPIR